MAEKTYFETILYNLVNISSKRQRGVKRDQDQIELESQLVQKFKQTFSENEEKIDHIEKINQNLLKFSQNGNIKEFKFMIESNNIKEINQV